MFNRQPAAEGAAVQTEEQFFILLSRIHGAGESGFVFC
jgi:hypothetical protein